MMTHKIYNFEKMIFDIINKDPDKYDKHKIMELKQNLNKLRKKSNSNEDYFNLLLDSLKKDKN